MIKLMWVRVSRHSLCSATDFLLWAHEDEAQMGESQQGGPSKRRRIEEHGLEHVRSIP